MFVLTIVIKQFQLVRGNAAQQDHYQRSLPAVLETLQVLYMNTFLFVSKGHI